MMLFLKFDEKHTIPRLAVASFCLGMLLDGVIEDFD